MFLKLRPELKKKKLSWKNSSKYQRGKIIIKEIIKEILQIPEI